MKRGGHNKTVNIVSGALLLVAIITLGLLFKFSHVNADVDPNAVDQTTAAGPTIDDPAILNQSPVKLVYAAYTVNDGDTLASIAEFYKNRGISADMIAWSNKMAVDAKLEAGSTINVPMSPGFVYTIKAGDSVEKLAAKYSTTANDIIEANDLAGVSIAEGMVILIANGTYVE